MGIGQRLEWIDWGRDEWMCEHSFVSTLGLDMVKEACRDFTTPLCCACADSGASPLAVTETARTCISGSGPDVAGEGHTA